MNSALEYENVHERCVDPDDFGNHREVTWCGLSGSVPKLVGDKGFYIYQQVYPFIGIFIVWTSYGFAVAVSKLLAGSTSAVKQKR